MPLRRKARPGGCRGRSGRGGRGGTGAWAWGAGGCAVLAILAYVPLLVVRAGVVTPDTKTYLYLDPGRFLAQVAFMWNPTVGLGTVNHQYIGYLLPMGPFFGLLALLHVPIWVAQRLWLGSILFAAGDRDPVPLPGPAAAWARARSWPRWPTCSRPTSCSTPGGSR